MSATDLHNLLKRVVELVMPNLRAYYRMPRKGRIVKTYASDGSYYADVQPLRNDDSIDAAEPMIPKVEIPVLWGGPERGVVCPPTKGTLCDITYYDGDPDYPRLSNFRWAKNKAPNCELGGFIIQQKPGVYIKIDAGGNIIHKTAADRINDIGGAKTETVGNDWNIEVGGSATIVAPAGTTIDTPTLTATGDIVATGNITAGGNVVAAGNVADSGGAKTMAAMRTVFDQHSHNENGDGGGVTDPPAQGM